MINLTFSEVITAIDKNINELMKQEQFNKVIQVKMERQEFVN